MKHIVSEISSGILTLTLSRAKVNAMNVELMHEFIQAFMLAQGSPSVRGILLRSAHKTFSAGLDLVDLHERSGGEDAAERLRDYCYHYMTNCFKAPLRCTKPVAVAINGHAIAGGMMFGFCGDFLSLSTKNNGSFMVGLSGLRVGVPFPALPIQLASKKLSPRAFTEVVYGSHKIPVEDAFARLGYGDFLSDEAPAEDAAKRWLEAVTSSERSLESFRITKQLFLQDIVQYEPPETEQNDWIRAIRSDQCRKTMERFLTAPK
eukprot:TRINITY_DN5070_c0_g1_i1.p1 TRINITY_DN5070_c0_g1~~TRINITY_DN5070_c0_g1_i1.p1  ORF type:complete len:262 (+),score=60.46 TRINITY_DN5070_c0_g1_i1:1-786(+)